MADLRRRTRGDPHLGMPRGLRGREPNRIASARGTNAVGTALDHFAMRSPDGQSFFRA
jgi:hypothetical protein